MCLFPLPNDDFNSYAYKRGVRYFDCGSCPECLRKRSNLWALRAVYECKSHVDNCMITLTYDSFKYDFSGNRIGENPVDPLLRVNKRHIQLFIKRLRKWYSSFSSDRIKYICCAEYGSRTHRAHYHLILFGVRFPDLVYYKKSKRNNLIYMSDILTNLWGYGICTVDSINVHAGVARYCTKYCAKERNNDTFMLASQHIGLNNLINDFNGRSYIIDGHEYPIPKSVWENYIMSEVNKHKYASIVSPKYVNLPSECKIDFNADRSAYDIACANRKRYRYIRDKNPLYLSYLTYWSSKGKQFESRLLSVDKRIYLLDEKRYHFYKIAALNVLDMRKNFIPFPAPGSGCISAFERYKNNLVPIMCPRFGHLSLPPRHNRTSDTIRYKLDPFLFESFDFDKMEKISYSKSLTYHSNQCIIDI